MLEIVPREWEMASTQIDVAVGLPEVSLTCVRDLVVGKLVRKLSFAFGSLASDPRRGGC